MGQNNFFPLYSFKCCPAFNLVTVKRFLNKCSYINFEGPLSPSSGEEQYRHLNGWVCPETPRGLQASPLLEEGLQRIQVPYLPLTAMNLRLQVAFCFSVFSSNRVMMMICKIVVTVTMENVKSKAFRNLSN